MITDYLLVAVALLWFIVASASDIKKREVSNWLNFSLVAVALAIRSFGAIFSKDILYFVYGVLGLIIFYLVGNLFYYTRVFGGGDAKLLVASGAIFATTPEFAKQSFIETLKIPFMAVFLVNLMLFGSVYGMFYSFALAAKNKKRFSKEFGKQKRKMELILHSSLIGFVLFVVLSFSANTIYFLFSILFLYPLLFVFVKAVENSCMIKLANANELTEGDWLVESVKIGKKIIKARAEGLNAEELKAIQKAKKKVLIKHGIPFVPVFLIALLASIFFGNILVEIVSSLM